jgi:hypothetical protein
MSPLQLGLVTAIAVVLASPIVVRVARNRFDPFEPIIVGVLAYGVMFVVRPASMIATNHLAYDGPRRSTSVATTFSEMLVLALLGALAFVLGYELSLGRRLASRLGSPHAEDERRLVVATLGAAGIALLSSALFLASSPFGFSTLTLVLRGRSAQLTETIADTSFYVWFAFLLLIPATLILVAVGFRRRSKLLLFTGLALGAIYLFRTIPLGTRAVLLPFVGGLTVLYYLRRSARPSLVATLVVVVVALAGSSFLSDLRSRGTRNESVSQTIVRAVHPARIGSPFTSGPDSEMAPVLAAALRVIPEQLPHTYGSTIFGDLVARPVPRTLWAAEARDGAINPEFSVLLYFYWDFGAPGIVIGLLLYGIGARLLFEYLIHRPSSLAVQVIYSLALWFVVIGMRNSPVDTFVLAMFIVFPTWLIFRLAQRAEMPVPAAAAR